MVVIVWDVRNIGHRKATSLGKNKSKKKEKEIQSKQNQIFKQIVIFK